MRVWCAQWFPRKSLVAADTKDPQFCAIQRQANPPPSYRDGLATLCGHWVICTGKIELREPTCAECLSALDKSPKSTRRARSLEGL